MIGTENPPSTSRIVATSDIDVSEYDVPFVGLPPNLDGAVVAHLSDLHRGCGAAVDEVIRRAVDVVNEASPDVVVVTGDFVDEDPDDIAPAVDLVSRLRARCGLFASLGNHDHRADANALSRALEAAGITVLQNTAVEITPGFWLAGVDDLLEGNPDLDRALSAVPVRAPGILLAHNPKTFRRIDPSRGLLVLSGHTHGGQIALPFPTPWMVCVFHLHTGYVHGWYRRGNLRMYVNRGIGVTGSRLTARRIRCQPEISFYRLRRA